MKAINERLWLPELEPIVRKAADIIFDFYGKNLTCTDKAEGGFVTEADLAVEAFLIEQLRKLLPEAAIMAEESGVDGDARYRWVIDPIDGTTNFAIGLPLFAISVALTDNDRVILGLTYIPLTDELFFAQEGKGATLNGKKIHVGNPVSFDRAVVGLSLPYGRKDRLHLVQAVEKVIESVYATRRVGSSCIDLAYVACGRFDGAVFAKLRWWDVAAGIILIQESGGKITDFQGNQLTPEYQSCIAGGSLVYDQLAQLLKK